jgi:hypothetical protein
MANILRNELDGNDRKPLKDAIDKAMRDQYGEGLEPERPAVASIIPPELWEPPEPPVIIVNNYGTDHATGATLLIAIGLLLAPIAAAVLILASAVPGLLVAFAAGIAVAFGVRILRSKRE